MVCAAEAGGKKKTQNHNPESGLPLLLRAAVLKYEFTILKYGIGGLGPGQSLLAQSVLPHKHQVEGAKGSTVWCLRHVANS